MNPLRAFDLTSVFEAAGLPKSGGGIRESEMRQRFGLSEPAFCMHFLRLVREPDVYAAFPVECGRAERLRARFQRERSAEHLRH